MRSNSACLRARRAEMQLLILVWLRVMMRAANVYFRNAHSRACEFSAMNVQT